MMEESAMYSAFHGRPVIPQSLGHDSHNQASTRADSTCPNQSGVSSAFTSVLDNVSERRSKSGKKSACNAEEGRLSQPWPLWLNYVLRSLYVPSAKHLLTLGNLSLLNKEEARPIRRGTSVYSHV